MRTILVHLNLTVDDEKTTPEAIGEECRYEVFLASGRDGSPPALQSVQSVTCALAEDLGDQGLASPEAMRVLEDEARIEAGGEVSS